MAYANNNGQILHSANGNAWGEPFLFGNALKKVSSSHNIERDGLNLAHEYTILLWYNFPVNSHNGAAYRYLSIEAGEEIFGSYSYGSLYWRKIGGSTLVSQYTPQITANVFDLWSIAVSKERNLARMCVDGDGTFFQKIQNQTNNSPNISKVVLGKEAANNGPASFMYSRFVLINRFCSKDEIRYHYNNKSGNHLLNKDNVAIDWRNDKAEVLDYSIEQDGSDMRACVRDYSGNNYHGKVDGLPTGTAQEQTDYANANLFQPVIS